MDKKFFIVLWLARAVIGAVQKEEYSVYEDLRKFELKGEGRLHVISNMEHVKVERELNEKVVNKKKTVENFQIDIDFTPYLEHCDELEAEAANLGHTLLGEGQEPIGKLAFAAEKRLHRVCSNIRAWPGATMNKRRSLLGKVTTWFLSFLGLKELFNPGSEDDHERLEMSRENEALKATLRTERQRVRELARKVKSWKVGRRREDNREKFQARQSIIRQERRDAVELFLRVVGDLENEEGRLTRGLAEAQQGKLSQELFTTKQVEEVVERLREKNRGEVLDHAIDFFHLPTSMWVGQRAATIFVHWPITKSSFNMYRLADFPILMRINKTSGPG